MTPARNGTVSTWTRIARALVIVSARLARRDFRERWREEWLGEIAAAPATAETLRRAFGAPRDALSTRAPQFSSVSPVLSGIGADVRDAIRSLRKTPLQTATVLACLAVGSTLTVAMFSIINGVIAGELPGVRDRASLVTLHVAHTADERRHSAPMHLTEFRAMPATSPGLSGMAAELGAVFAVDANGGTTAHGAYVTGSYFPVLGTVARIGRLIGPRDDTAGGSPVAVLGYGFWQSHFGGRPDVLGQTLRIGTGQFRVIGVAPRDFAGFETGRIGDSSSSRPAIWLPLAFRASAYETTVSVVGRLAPGVTIDRAEAQAPSMIPMANAALGRPQIASIRLEPLHLAQLTGTRDIAKFIASFMTVPLIVLAIACANVAGVQLSRAITRTHELSVRVSIGASRWRVTRLLVVETLLLAFGAGAVSWFGATQTLRLCADLLPFTPVADARVVLFAVALPVLVTIIAGLYPAWRATGFDVLSGLRLGARVGRTVNPVLRRRVLIVQTALSVFLLVTSILLVRGLERLPTLIGPSYDDVIVSEVRLGGIGFSEAEMADARAKIVRQMRAQPGVTRVGQSEWSVFFGSDAACWADATQPNIDAWGVRSASAVTADYFTSLRVQPLRGRVLGRDEPDGGVVVNEAFLAAYPAPRPDVGSLIRVRRARQASAVARIVGVVPNGYERYPRGLPEATCYLPLRDAEGTEWFTLYVQSARPAAVAPALQGLLAGVDSRLALGKSGTMNARLWREYAGLDLVSRALGTVSLTALLLAMVGLFGAISHGTSQRSHEFGVRLALGAKPRALALSILGESLAVNAKGVTLGLALATPLAMFFHRRLLSTITMNDPWALSGVIGAVSFIAVAAAVLPARRASAVNPVTALRAD